MIITKGKQRLVLRVISDSYHSYQVLDAWKVFLMLKVSSVVTGNQGDFVIAVELANFSQKFLHLVGFLYTDAVNQFCEGAILNRTNTDQFGNTGVFEKSAIKDVIVGCIVGDLHAQNLAGYFAGEPVEAGHQKDHQADNDGCDQPQQVETSANGHANCHGEEDKAHVAGLFDGVAEADDREGAHQRKGAGNVGTDDHHHQSYNHTVHHQGEDKTLGVGGAAVGTLVNPADEGAGEKTESQYQHHVNNSEFAGQIGDG
jgi:hypothetical protein